jgi:hypothetical protein
MSTLDGLSRFSWKIYDGTTIGSLPTGNSSTTHERPTTPTAHRPIAHCLTQIPNSLSLDDAAAGDDGDVLDHGGPDGSRAATACGGLPCSLDSLDHVGLH